MNTFKLILALVITAPISLAAQNHQAEPSYFAIETRITSILQGGFEIGIFYNTNSNYSIGLQFANQNIEGVVERLVFNSSDYSKLDIRLVWLFAVKARHHFSDSEDRAYIEVSSGLEQFTIQAKIEEDQNINGFVSLSIGYNWQPFDDFGLYINPFIGIIYTFSRGPEKKVDEINYRLKPIFPSVALSLGWKF